MTTIAGIDPRTGAALAPVAHVTTTEEVARLTAAADAAATDLRRLGRLFRADLLDALAGAVEERRDDLIRTASQETGFNDAKLGGELTRTVFQFRFFADVVRDGGYLEATVDPASDTPMGPRPDLRRMLVPIGPVAVFGASNFPFAFSVLGGDTASAIAAGSPIIVKAHSSHPATSQLSFEILRDAAAAVCSPAGTFGIVFGTRAGADLVADASIKAVGFTGSLNGGKALLEVIGTRSEPIPFYGELSSINPVIVTPGAAAERGADIGRGLIASITTGSGQLCTKPGLVLVPAGADGDRLVEAARSAVAGVPAQTLLNERIYTTYSEDTVAVGRSREIRQVGTGRPAGEGFSVAAKLFETTVEALGDGVIDEIFGPVTVVVRFSADSTTTSVTRALDTLSHSLTATLHTGPEESDLTRELTAVVEPRAGRVIYNGFPTGVAVSWAQTHGGPWPSTNSIHTSVGATAIRRFLRPITFQDAPESVLPEELRDNCTQIPRRIDGVLRVAD
ncbi:NADP-dependent aldehyde dehydrogenase [Rhodococcus sp. 27YEA15]|uniref:aldehyde dehydrogenase (NADP(+)) n=1 Tax=Rhodococcus sp. 27YEA15 TaxID=3156259 RepID=UPI003C7E4983